MQSLDGDIVFVCLDDHYTQELQLNSCTTTKPEKQLSRTWRIRSFCLFGSRIAKKVKHDEGLLKAINGNDQLRMPVLFRAQESPDQAVHV
jgi:hypothetical protein